MCECLICSLPSLLFYFGLIVCNGRVCEYPRAQVSAPIKNHSINFGEYSKIHKIYLNSVHKKHIFTLKPL